MKYAIRVGLLVTMLATVALATDITGTWKGSFDFSGNAVPVTLTLKASGETLTGTVEGIPAPDPKIQDGKVQGDTVTFSVMVDYQGQAIKLVYKGKVTKEDEIQFQFGTEDGSWGTDLTVKKSS